MPIEIKDITSFKFKLSITVLVVLSCTLFLISLSYNTGSRIITKYAPLVDAAMEIKLEATTAHLWFEEILTDDGDQNITAVNQNIKNAIWYAEAMLYGGKNDEGDFQPLDNKALETNIKHVLLRLKEFQEIARIRHLDHLNNLNQVQHENHQGHIKDTRFDVIFKEFITEADIVETELQNMMRQELKTYQTLNYLIALISSVLIIGVFVILYYVQKNKIKNSYLLQESHMALQDSLDIVNKHVLTFTINKTNQIISVSDAFCKASGYSEEELIGKQYDTLCHPDLDQDLSNNIKNNHPWSNELHCLTKDHKTYHLFANMTPSQFMDGEYVFINEDITDKKRIEQLSLTDKLTQMSNRLHLDQMFNIEVYRAQRYNSTFSIIFLDIDHFKNVNDTYGHDVGDSVLIEIAKILKESIRSSDTAGRWGGEEFIIICPETTKTGAQVVAEKLRQDIQNHTFTTAKHQTCSFGVTEFLPNDTSSKEMIKRSDEALYKAKENGRNQVVVI